MKILTSFTEYEAVQGPFLGALGAFDGLHIGHQQVIQTMVTHARTEGMASMVITFTRHPQELLHPEKSVRYLMEERERCVLLEAWGVDYLFLMPLTEALLEEEPEEFVATLCQGDVRHLYMGQNFAFGRCGRGTPALLEELVRAKNIQVHTMPLFTMASGEEEEAVVSSTRIRKALELGNIPLANALLGHPFGFHGTVIHGDQRGRILGFPTVNFLWNPRLVCPPDGVYVNRVFYKGEWIHGVGNIGDNPTFENQIHRFEIHLLDYEGDLYGEEMYIEFLAYLRGEYTFAHIDDLIRQMDQDKEETREFFKSFLCE